MCKTEVSSLPSFFYNDKKNKKQNEDKGHEALQDFFLKWTLHCAEDTYINSNLKLQEYARRIVFVLIHGKTNGEKYIIDKEINDSFRVKRVITMHEWNDIDIVAEIEIEENNISEKYVLNIEDKYYQRIKDNQLEKSKKFIIEEYSDPEFKIINLVIFADRCIIDKEPDQLEKCQKNGYNLLSLEDITILAGMRNSETTGNALFDEFWFYYYP